MRKINHKNHAILLIVLLSAAMVSGGIAAAEKSTEQRGINDAKEGAKAEKRDPFWPVGYSPNNVQNETGQVAPVNAVKTVVSSWSTAMKQIVINGVSSRTDNEYYAVINGDVKSVGDTVSVRMGGSVYTWAVDGIEPPGSVKLRRLSVR